VLKISLSIGILNLDSSWLVWLLVLVGAVLVAVALLRRRIWDKGGSIEHPKEPIRKSLESGVEITQEKFIENNQVGPVEIPQQVQSVSAKSGTSQVKHWLHQVVDFIGCSSKIQSALELLLIFLMVFSFCQSFLNFESNQELPGNESQMFQALDWVFYQSVTQNHQFPIWNPWMRTGQPMVADPMFHSLNPLVGVSTLVWGVQNGFKVALFLSLLIAALGMRQLGASLGLSRVVRIWMALVFTFAGQPLAHALQGQYLFIFGFAWIPWSVWGLYKLWHTHRVVYIALSALAIALLVLSGNSYYAFYLAFAAVLFVIVTVITIQSKSPFVRVDWRMLGSYTAVGILSLSLVAIHVLPLLQFSSSMNKGVGIYGSQTPWQVLLDFTSKNTFRPDAYSDLPAREEYYAYLGWVPLILALFAPFAFRKSKRRIILFASLLLVFVILWIDLKQMPWRPLYESSQFLLLFRHILRPLMYGSFAIVLLAGLGLSSVWLRVKAFGRETPSNNKTLRLGARWTMGLLVMVMGASVFDVYTTHQPFFQTEPACQAETEAMALLVANDPGEYYTQFFPNNVCLEPLLVAGARFLAPWYAWEDYRQLEGSLETRMVQAKQRYTIQPLNDPAPEGAIPAQIQTNAYRVYYHPDSLPMAFSVSRAVLEQPNGGLLGVDEVSQQTLYFDGPNRVEINAAGQANERLVLLVTHDPGWSLYVDGKPAPVLKISGYLAADMQTGTHQYKFIYLPRPYQIGLLLSMVGLLVSISLVVYDTRFAMATWPKKLQRFLKQVRSINLRERLNSTRQLKKVRGYRPALPIQREAVYHNSKSSGEGSDQSYLTLANPLNAQDGQTVNLIVEVPPWSGDQQTLAGPIRTAWQRWRWASRGMVEALVKPLTLGGVLFSAALLVYLLTRFIGLTQFPISFLGDEAAQTLYAETLISSHFHDPVTGLYFPIYVEAAGNRWTPLLPMYIQAATLAVFGKSVLVTRGTSVIVGVLAAIAVGFILKQIFKAKLWWVGVLLVAIIPAWFLHSRTAFETVMTTAFFAMFLWFYLRYRDQGASVVPALIFGALTFYTYSNGQLITLAVVGLLFISDVRYHWQQRKALARALPIAVLLALPFILFTVNKPSALSTHLRVVDSYWFHNIPLTEKVFTFLKNYLYGLSPAYWFFPNGTDLPRHRMLNIAQLPISMLPFMLIGLGLCLWHFRESKYRAVLLAGLAVPVGASLVQIGITRVLPFIIPASILMGLGIEWLFQQIRNRIKLSLQEWIIAGPLFVILSGMSFGLLRNSLVNGPVWFNDYGLYGMQYGAIQIFEKSIPQYWSEDPNLHFRVSAVWANGTERFLTFFLTEDEQQKVDLISIDGLMSKKYNLEANDIFVLTPGEYDKAVTSDKFKVVQVEDIIPYPDQTPGFYFIRLAYADNIDQLLQAEKAERSILKEDEINLDGQLVTVRYSWIDMGEPAQIFDNDPFTLIRGMEANPFILELSFQQSRTISGISLNLGAMDADLKVELTPAQGGAPVYYQESFRDVREGDILTMNFPDVSLPVTNMHLEIHSANAGEIANVHIRELKLLP
jgi:hypothetical protein